MTKYVLISLWDKICNIFATKSELADIVENKQDKLTAGIGIRIEGNTIINQAIPTTDKEEIVQVAITFDSQENLPDGFDITEDLPITVFYNNESEPFETYNLDDYGMCSFTVPYGYRYRIEFPTLLGYKFVDDEEHIATVIERSVEKLYKIITIPSHEDLTKERVIILLNYYTGLNTMTAMNNIEVEVEIDSTTTTYTSNSQGVVDIYIPIGTTYKITVPIVQGYYIYDLVYSKTFLAENEVNIINFSYYRYNSGLFLVDKDGIYELKYNEAQEALNAGLLSREDMKFIEYKSNTYIQYNSCFLMDIDDIADHSHNLKLLNKYLWGGANYPSLNPKSVIVNDSSHFNLANLGEQFYNGYLMCKLMQSDGVIQGISTPLINEYLNTHVLLGNNTLTAFIPTRSLHHVIYNNLCREYFHLSRLARPNAPYSNLRTTTSGGTGIDWYLTSSLWYYSGHIICGLSAWFGGTAGGPYPSSTINSYTLLGLIHKVFQYPCYNLEPDLNAEITTPHYIVSNGVKVLCNEDGNIATLFDDADEQNNVTWKAITWDSNGLHIITLNDNDWQDILDLIAVNGKCWFTSGGTNKFLIGEDEYTFENGDWDTTITEFTANTLYRRLETDTWILCNSNGEELITEDSESGDTYYYTCDNVLINNQYRWDKTLLETTLPSGTSGVSIPNGIVSGKVTINGTDYQVDSPRRNAIYNSGN